MGGREEIERLLERFIREELLDSEPFGGDPLERGAVDSLGIEQLVEHVESELGVVLVDEEMTRANFESVAALAALVESKLPVESP
jgi:acyl carrier protein